MTRTRWRGAIAVLCGTSGLGSGDITSNFNTSFKCKCYGRPWGALPHRELILRFSRNNNSNSSSSSHVGAAQEQTYLANISTPDVSRSRRCIASMQAVRYKKINKGIYTHCIYMSPQTDDLVHRFKASNIYSETCVCRTLDQGKSCTDRTNFHAPKCCGSIVHPWIKRNPVISGQFPLHQGHWARAGFTCTLSPWFLPDTATVSKDRWPQNESKDKWPQESKDKWPQNESKDKWPKNKSKDKWPEKTDSVLLNSSQYYGGCLQRCPLYCLVLPHV